MLKSFGICLGFLLSFMKILPYSIVTTSTTQFRLLQNLNSEHQQRSKKFQLSPFRHFLTLFGQKTVRRGKKYISPLKYVCFCVKTRSFFLFSCFFIIFCQKVHNNRSFRLFLSVCQGNFCFKLHLFHNFSLNFEIAPLREE